ncbi:MAG: hypothetical protein WDN44_07465 [Sphingomonas sp.]
MMTPDRLAEGVRTAPPRRPVGVFLNDLFARAWPWLLLLVALALLALFLFAAASVAIAGAGAIGALALAGFVAWLRALPDLRRRREAAHFGEASMTPAAVDAMPTSAGFAVVDAVDPRRAPAVPRDAPGRRGQRRGSAFQGRAQGPVPAVRHQPRAGAHPRTRPARLAGNRARRARRARSPGPPCRAGSPRGSRCPRAFATSSARSSTR